MPSMRLPTTPRRQVDGEALVAQRAEVAGLGRHRADVGEGAGLGEVVGVDAVGDGEEDVGDALVGEQPDAGELGEEVVDDRGAAAGQQRDGGGRRRRAATS